MIEWLTLSDENHSDSIGQRRCTAGCCHSKASVSPKISHSVDSMDRDGQEFVGGVCSKQCDGHCIVTVLEEMTSAASDPSNRAVDCSRSVLSVVEIVGPLNSNERERSRGPPRLSSSQIAL